MIKDSPWGAVQHQHSYCRGVTGVSTASHGGIAVADGFAHKNLSEAARSRAGFHYSGYYWYEEDCDWAIPIFELPHLWEEAFRWMPNPNNAEEHRKYLHKSLSRWNADYLIASGIEPDPDYYAEYLQMKERWAERGA